MSVIEEINTPWRKAFSRFGMTQNQFAQAVGWHRSKISRALADERGLINGPDQERIMSAAKRLGLDIPPEDLLPSVQ